MMHCDFVAPFFFVLTIAVYFRQAGDSIYVVLLLVFVPMGDSIGDFMVFTGVHFGEICVANHNLFYFLSFFNYFDYNFYLFGLHFRFISVLFLNGVCISFRCCVIAIA